MTDSEIISLIRKIKTSSWRELFEINWKMWEKEDEITANIKDLKKVGKLYLELRELTKQRAKIKGEKKTY